MKSKTKLPRRISLAIKYRPTSELSPDAKNCRTHSADQIRQLVASIQEFGWTNPILTDGESGVIAGHARLAAAKLMGLASVPCIDLAGLTSAQKRAYVIADNKLAMNAGWDINLLASELADLNNLNFDLSFTGFDLKEITDILESAPQSKDVKDDIPDVDKSAQLLRILGANPGQLWQIGRHRMFIGDSASAENKKSLFGDATPDGICTDPPYELSALRVAGILDGLRIPVAVAIMGDTQALEFARHWDVRFLMVWRHRKPKSKTFFMPIIYHALIVVAGANKKIKLGWKRPRTDYGSVFETVIEYEDKTGFGQGKHADVFEEMMAGFGWQNVCDPFLGTGATLIACERTGRTCYGFEIDPAHAAVCLERYRMAGLNPKLEGNTSSTARPGEIRPSRANPPAEIADYSEVAPIA
jgi:hypothetical protein